MLYRLYLPADFPQLYAIEQLCFQPPFAFPAPTCANSSQIPTPLPGSPKLPAESTSAEEDQQMTGFAIVDWAQHQTQTAAYIQTIEVAPAHRKRGIATELLRRVETSAIAAGAQILGSTSPKKTPPPSVSTRPTAFDPRAGKRTTTPPASTP